MAWLSELGGGTVVGPGNIKLGVYDPTEPYNAGDIVNYDGQLYRAIRSTQGDQPDVSPLDWQLLPANADGADGRIQFALSGALSSDAEFTYDADTDIVSIKYQKFDITADAPTHAEGVLFWDKDHYTIAILNDKTETSLQVGQELWQRVYNNSAVTTINNGQGCYISGSGIADPNGITFPSVGLAIANDVMKSGLYGVATHDINPETWGWITRSGPLHDFDTSSWVPGTTLYLSPDTEGLLTSTEPVSPNYLVIAGVVLRQDVSGSLGVSPHWLGNRQSASTILNGASIESVAVSAASDGATITASIENSGGGDIWFWFGNKPTFFDATPAATIALTAGTDINPVLNYVFVTSSAVLTANTTGYPTTDQFAPIARIWCKSAATTQVDGLYRVHAETDHLSNIYGVGHLRHINDWIRQRYATYVSGMATSFSGSPGATPQIAVASGEIFQLHRHTSPAFPSGHHFYIVNDPTTAYKRGADLSAITQDSTGASINNKYIAVVLSVIVSENDADCQLLLMLPSGGYNSESDARIDLQGHTNYSIEAAGKGSTVLNYRIIMRNASGTITVYSGGPGDDLRGTIPSSPSGSSVTVGTSFPDNVFEITNSTDPTKIINFLASSITTGNTITLTVQDADGTIEYTGHTIASHGDTTATGTELETLTDGSNADTLHSHANVASHTIASHNDTTATGAELETLTDGSDADSLHSHNTFALKSNVLELNNTTSFTPDADYEPATKKYVDDNTGIVDKWTDLTATTDFSSTAPSTSTITMNTDQTGNIKAGMAVKFTSTANGGVCYARCKAITSSLLSIEGVALNTGSGDLTSLSYSNLPNMVEILNISVSGQFGDATDTSLLENDLLLIDGIRWDGPPAHIVAMQHKCINDDTGATQTNINVTSGGANVFTSGSDISDTTWQSTGVTASRANYEIASGEHIELTATVAGNGDATDLNANIIIIYE